MLYYKDKGLGDGATTYVKAFTRLTWICILIVFFICVIVYVATVKIGPYQYSSDFGAFILYHALVQQGDY